MRVVERSGNRKTGIVHATHVSQSSCPGACPLQNNGCYAENFPQAFTTRRLNEADEQDPVVLALVEADGVRRLSGKLKLRGHVVGDCTDPRAARIVGQAYSNFERRTGQKAWTYTHAWRDIPEHVWMGANVLASCESPQEVQGAKANGYATSMIVTEFEKDTVYERDGIKILPCPEQLGRLNCSTCGVCQNVEQLKKHDLTVGFETHGAKVKAANQVIEAKEAHV